MLVGLGSEDDMYKRKYGSDATLEADEEVCHLETKKPWL